MECMEGNKKSDNKGNGGIKWLMRIILVKWKKP